MRKGTKKVIARVMAALMAFSLLPMSPSGGASEVKAEETKKTYVLDAEQLANFTSSGDYFKAGTEDYFTIMCNAGKSAAICNISAVTSNGTAIYDEETLDWSKATDLGVRTRCVRLAGGGLGTNTADSVTKVVNGIKITTKNADASVVIYYSPKGTTERNIKVTKATDDDSALGTEVGTYGATITKASVEKTEFTLQEAGSYYIGFSGDGGIIPYMEVTETVDLEEISTPTPAATEEPASTPDAGEATPTPDVAATEAPTEAPTTAPTQQPEGDEFVNGLEASSVEAGKSYYYDFTGVKEAAGAIDNNYASGLFSFNAGSYNQATYHSTTYGIEFKSGNKLTFPVAGNSYIVVGGDSNNNCTELTASSETGTCKPETQTTKTGGHASLEDCKTQGSNTLIYEYTGTEGSVTLTVDPSYTKAEGQTSTKAYIAYVCVIPMEEKVPEEEGSIKADTYNFSNKTPDEIKAVEGLNLDSSKFDSATNSHGIRTASETTIELNLEGNATITVTSCRYNAGLNGTMTSSEGTVTSKEIDESGAGALEFTVTGASGKTILTFAANMYLHSIKVEYVTVPDRPALDPDKLDVWDFGAEEVAGAFNNLTVDVINAFYPDTVKVGEDGYSISSFNANDGNGVEAVKFVSDKTNNRIRTTNTKITRYDAKSLGDNAGNTYTGYVYSNSSSTDATRLEIYLYEGDTLTCMLGSNGTAATYILRDPSGKDYDTFEFSAAAGVEEAVFHAAEEGWYQLYCSNEKLVCARIIRKHAPELQVSGTVTVPAGMPAGYGVIFTNEATGKETVAEVKNNAYSCTLYGGYTYSVSLKDANGFVIDPSVILELADKDETQNLTVKAVAQNEISGEVTGLSKDALAKVEFEFKIPQGKVYAPELVLDRTTGEFTLTVETGVEYEVEALNVNDFKLDTTTITASADKTQNIEFTKKPVYPVTLTITGVADSSKAVVTFTNINEEGYVYTFNVADKMELRDGSYSVKVAGLGNYAVSQGTTPNVNVKGAAASTTVPFEEFSSWDFSVLNNTVEIETIDGANYYAGLALTGSAAKNKTYLLANSGATITVPGLEKGDKVTIKYCYCAAFTAGSINVDEKSGSTAQIDAKDLVMEQDGDLVIEAVTGQNANQTYLCAIEVLKASEVVAYKDTLYVGADKEFKNINDALASVRKMARTEDQKVTIMIDPGNYEEMLVIDTPNVTLKNASAAPSIALKNKGVDIDENAVRVTWYYGHGYTYYSMGSDCKYDADILAANKSNGYASFKNPGSGTTNGSYWNATVVITADNVNAEGIIFENSFNQYVSAKSVEDVIEAQGVSAKEGTVPRAEMKTVGDTKVQEKDYVERAAALAITNNVKQVYFNNCKFIGRQDTLYGGTGVTAGFEKCAIYGGTDYIFGGMTAVFKKCDLVFNTNDQTSSGLKNDVGYITAPQQSSGRGYLMYECTVTSTIPGVDTASEHTSKPGYLGRPWQAKTGEAVFYNTTIEVADAFWNSDTYKYGESLIRAEGWNSGLGGESELSVEYGTIEEAGVDNSAKRVSWASVLDTPNLADGSPITIETFLGSWNPFGPDDEKEDLIVIPDEDSPVTAVVTEGDVVFKDTDNEEVTGEVIIKADAQTEASASADIKTEVNKIKEEAQKAGQTATVLYYDISAYLVEGNTETAVALTSGTVKIKFSYPEGFSKANDIIVLHEAQKLSDSAITKEDNGFWIAASSFSPYTIIFKSVAAANPTPTPTPDDDNKDPEPTPTPDNNVKDGDDDDDDDDDIVTAPTNPVVGITSPKTYDDSMFNFVLPSEAKTDEDGQQGALGADAVVVAAVPQNNGISLYWFVIVAAAAVGIIVVSGVITFRRREEE